MCSYPFQWCSPPDTEPPMPSCFQAGKAPASPEGIPAPPGTGAAPKPRACTSSKRGATHGRVKASPLPKSPPRTPPHAPPFTHPPAPHAALARTDGHRQAPVTPPKPLRVGTFPSHHIPALFRAESAGRSRAPRVPRWDSAEAAASSSWSPARTPRARAGGLGEGPASLAGCRWPGSGQPLAPFLPGASPSLFPRQPVRISPARSWGDGEGGTQQPAAPRPAATAGPIILVWR